MTHLHAKDFEVRPIAMWVATHFMQNHHYSKSTSRTSVYCHGLFRKGDIFDVECLGVAMWLPPTKAAAVATYPEGRWQKVLSLSRLAVADSVPTNGASFLLGQSIRMIDRKSWHCLVTYADTWRGHTGAIYRATNWEFMGETAAHEVWVKNGVMRGRKRGPKNFTGQQMRDQGYICQGKFSKLKFRMVLVQ